MAKCDINQHKKKWNGSVDGIFRFIKDPSYRSSKVDGAFKKVGDVLSKADEAVTNKLNSMQSKYHFKNIFAVHESQKAFGEWIREFRLQQRGILIKAKEVQQLLSSLDDKDSQALVRALNGDLDPLTLDGDLRKTYEAFRSMIDSNAQELIDLGVLKDKNAIKDYLKRVYKEHVDGSASARMFFDRRFKSRKDMSHDERIAAGMIEDASFVIPKTIMEQKMQALKARMLKGIADQFGKDEPMEGYVRVPDDTVGGGVYRYGALAGKYVPAEIYGSLRGAAFAKGEFSLLEDLIYPLVDHIKVNVTVKNPATHVYNVMSNFLMSYMHGDMRALGRVLRMAVYDKERFSELVQEANKHGLNSVLDDLEPVMAQGPNGKDSIVLTIMKNLYASADSKVGKGMRTAYEWEDKIFKLAAFEGNMKKMREELGRDLNDAEKRQAFKEANEAYVDYDSPLPSLVRGLDKGGVFPFLHYTWKSTPVVAKAIAKNPLRFIILQAALIGMGASAWFGDDDDEIKPEWAADQLNLLGSKEWVNLGNGWFLNAGRLIPGAKIGGLDFEAGFMGGLFKISTGLTPLGYKIGSKYDNKAETVAKRGAALAENYAPPLSPIGRYGQRVEKKVAGNGKKNSSTGEEMNYDEIGGQPLGFRKFSPQKEAQKKANAIKNEYEHNIDEGMNKTEALQIYRTKVETLRAASSSQGIVGLKIDSNPGNKNKKGLSGPGAINISPKLKL